MVVFFSLGQASWWVHQFMSDEGYLAYQTAYRLATTGSYLVIGYAILRHRVFDFGFALNRILVYSLTSVTLLVMFGLVEWLAEQLLHFKEREESAILDALIALGVYLAFHRVRHYVEHGVEKLLFKSWHENEHKLRRFVRQAAHITNGDRLTTALSNEVPRFTNGAQVAVYRRGDHAILERVSGEEAFMPPELDENDPIPLALRADRIPLETESGLALPMMHRGVLAGLVAVGPRPEGTLYRPDEIELLAFAANQVGLDLYALEVDELRRRLDQMQNRLERAPAFDRTEEPLCG